ncbi:ATPase, T2SS/T4P/T4SS family [Vibrio lentus]|nr:ATPase, T2SS/T4P/T4SS family [Vibrio lentus]
MPTTTTFSLRRQVSRRRFAESHDAPIIKLINAMLGEAIKEGASIFISKPSRSHCLSASVLMVYYVMFLHQVSKLAPLLVSRVKVMAVGYCGKTRQDGRISCVSVVERSTRVSTMPSSHGERVVMRLLDKNATRLDLHSLGMTAENHENFRKLILRPHGTSSLRPAQRVLQINNLVCWSTRAQQQ